MEIDIEVGIAALETGEDLWEEIGAHHRRNTNFNRSFLELLVVVHLEHGILYVAQCYLDALQKDCALGREGELLLAAVEELDAKFAFEFFYRDSDVRLGNTETFGSTRDILEAARHLEVFQLPQFHVTILLITLFYSRLIISYF